MTIRVHHLNCGTMCVGCQRLINGHGSWRKPGELVCHCLLLETPDALVLVDTGIGQQDILDPARRLGRGFVAMLKPRLSIQETAAAQIKALGFDPKDVRHILPTHLDLDHAGGLGDFPEAQVHVFKPELESALAPRVRDRMRYRPMQFNHQPRWASHDEGGEDWFGFKGIRPVAGLGGEVLIVPLIGHTRGHSGIAVRSGDKWLLHCGDAYFHHSQVSATPAVPLGLRAFEASVQTLRGPRLANQQRLRQLASEHGDQVELFCAHDPQELERYSQG
ncbi:MAG: MBL fold metallo-hydrolase [Pseudomonas sp.]